MPTNPSRIVVTDGFHITRPVEVVYTQKRTYYFEIVCAIENAQLIAGVIITAVVYAMSLTSGILLLKILSMVPIAYLLFLYYINRKQFIQIRPA